MFIRHKQFSFIKFKKIATTTYKNEISFKTSEILGCKHHIQEGVPILKTGIFEIYTIHHSEEGFCNRVYATYIKNYHRHLSILDRVKGYTRIYVFRKMIQAAIKNFEEMTKYWRNLFENHYIAAIQIKREVNGNEKCSRLTRKVIRKFIDMSEKFLLDKLNYVFLFPLEYFEIFAQKYPKQTTAYAIKLSKTQWLSKEMACIICAASKPELLKARTKLISRIFSFPLEICEIISEYLDFQLGRPFIDYFNETYDYENNKPHTNYESIKYMKKSNRPNQSLTGIVLTFMIQILD